MDGFRITPIRCCVMPVLREGRQREQNPESRSALDKDPHLHPLPHRERRQNRILLTRLGGRFARARGERVHFKHYYS